MVDLQNVLGFGEGPLHFWNYQNDKPPYHFDRIDHLERDCSDADSAGWQPSTMPL